MDFKDLNDLQDKWTEMHDSLPEIEYTISKEKMDKMKTAQEKLVAQYRTFVIASGLMTIVSLISWWRLFGALIGLLLAAFFLMAMAMDYMLMRKVAAIDIAEMPVSEVAERARKSRRFHHICQIILIPIAILLVGTLCYTQTSNDYFLWGCATGALLGIAMGLRIYFRMMDNYKKMIQ